MKRATLKTNGTYTLVRDAIKLTDEGIIEKLRAAGFRDETIYNILDTGKVSQHIREKLVPALERYCNKPMMLNSRGAETPNEIQKRNGPRNPVAYTAKVEEPPVQMKQMDIEDIIEEVIGKRYKGTITITLDIEES